MSLRPILKRRRISEARRGAHMACPDCRAPMTIRGSHVQSDTMRALQYCCTNHECGAAFSAVLELSARLSLPAQPNPEVHLPLSNRLDRGQLRAVLDQSGEVAPKSSSLPPITADMFGEPAPP